MHALLSLSGVFVSILVLARIGVPLWLAVLAGAVEVGILFGQTRQELFITLANGVWHPRTLGLVFITLLQLTLTHTLEERGVLQRMVTLARAVVRRPAVAMALMPAIVGLLPMPGGALFSAPMVAAATGGTQVPGSTLSAINYWFRHIWEHWWPTYPGVLLAMTLTGRSFGSFASTQIPLGLIMVVGGLLIFRGTHPDLHVSAPRPPRGTHRKLLAEAAPVWFIVAVALPSATIWRHCAPASLPPAVAECLRMFAPVALGLAVALAWSVWRYRCTWREVARSGTRKDVGVLLLLVLSVMVFQHVLTQVQAAQAIARELQAWRVPLVLVLAVLPWIAGAVTGLAVGFVGTSFPIVLPLIDTLAQSPLARAALIALAYAFGHLGQMLSPLHLCYVVSNRYFNTPFDPVYRQLLLPALAVAALTVVYVAVLYWAG